MPFVNTSMERKNVEGKRMMEDMIPTTEFDNSSKEIHGTDEAPVKELIEQSIPSHRIAFSLSKAWSSVKSFFSSIGSGFKNAWNTIRSKFTKQNMDIRNNED